VKVLWCAGSANGKSELLMFAVVLAETPRADRAASIAIH
jgi:hypothetical protein